MEGRTKTLVMAHSPSYPLSRWLHFLPALSAQQPESTRPAAEPNVPAADALKGTAILIVDDEQDARRFLGLILRRYGADVQVAASAREAFELYREKHPDVLVSDIAMPEASGQDLISWIRREEQGTGTHLPAIAVTALTAPQHREAILASGFDLHVGKPFDVLQLVRCLVEMLGGNGRSR